MKAIFTLLFLFSFKFLMLSQNVSVLNTKNGSVQIQPILHGSLVLTYQNTTIYIDPYGGEKNYENIKSPDIILITDIHRDHLDETTLDSIDTSKTIFITPQAVYDQISEKYKSKITVLNNGQGVHRFDIFIEALPMYNLPENPPSKKHPKGRGNGYILTIDNAKIYISGDTEDIIEMRNLQNIDVAFVCMNLPYTMTIEQAASAVLAFQPKIVYPYHYRGSDGFSNIEAFKKMVNDQNKNIEVRLSDWYPKG
ncbi:MBL fold metallo-hydrolase [Lutibacter sp. HS1-25]|uniref:MBL fold metallo-hydrolase n=1 Tax=Lutibacter sp. HS1-25 TaxID=2485000 RepID=UPI00101101A3|nr:MBL fold metallo-hydrolase [Lutibacter sp. HS1-25]RXP63547.1 MBL fold metallo-hydrolase [Lutibacter sp. HS1-25]